MKSPFPGMDPYLERFWNDVHGPLINYLREELNEWLPPRYRAAMQERVVISDVDQPFSKSRYPDVAVLDTPGVGGVAVAARSKHLLVRAPNILTWDVDPITEYSVEILDTRFGEKVVTAIEVLSPENKRPGDGMTQFRRKQQEYRRAGVSRVEIDLLRQGRRMFEFPDELLSKEQSKPYYVSICRGAKPGEGELYAIDLRDPLPTIGIPLRPEDPDVALDLQPLIEHVYRTGRFPIDYTTPCDPPLDGEDAIWARFTIEPTK